MADSPKSFEELETELVGLKIRLRRVEDFIQAIPTPEDYVPEATFDDDELIDQAIEVVREYDAASASLLQRKLSIGYARAARLIDKLEKNGIIGPQEGSKPRKVLLDKSVDKEKGTSDT